MESNKLDAVAHNFFGRKGGCSQGLFSTLNCSKFVGDEINSVEKNLEYVKNFFEAKKLITLKQIHGADCVIVDENSESDFEADAIVTKSEKIALGILTADCAPILFLDKEKKIIGAAHAGWKGAVAGVIESTVEKMVSLGGDVKNIFAAIGPCIHLESYEVDDDFLKNFSSKSSFKKLDGKFHFSITEYCKEKFSALGISENNIDVIDIDTYQKHDEYFSYRYARKNSNGICGRNISVICLKSAG